MFAPFVVPSWPILKALAALGGAKLAQHHIYHRRQAWDIARESNILRSPRAVLWDTRRGACDMLQWGRFPRLRYGWAQPTENRLEVSAATSSPKTQPISLGMFQGPSSRGSTERSEEILVASLELEPIRTLFGFLVPALPARWSMNNICEQDLCPVSTVKCTLCGCPLPVPENTRQNPARRLKIPASSYSPAREGGIQGLSFFLCFHMLCVPFPVLTNICEHDFCLLSIAHSIAIRFLCRITLGQIR